MRSTQLFSAFCALSAAAALTGCGDPLSLLPARFENREDTVAVWAATNTPINLPSAYILSARTRVRLDQVSTFDFVFDVDPAGRFVLLPLGAVVNTGGATGIPGLQKTPTPFASITTAEQLGYITKDTVVLSVGDIYYVRGTVDPECFLGIPYYGKLQILALDEAERGLRFRILTNINCGYRGLQPGIPTQ
jgi:hypothetical protein